MGKTGKLTAKYPKAVLLDERALLIRVQRVQHRRGHKTLTKTVRALLEERLLDIQHNDPHALPVELVGK